MYSILEEQSADPVPADKAFYEGAIPGMLRRLDPHSVFFDPGQFQQLKELEKSTRKGFGTVVSLLPGRVIILQVLPNTPSARAGLSPGDEILAVNNIALNRLDIEQLVQVLGQTRQRQARLDVRRPGNARLPAIRHDPRGRGRSGGGSCLRTAPRRRLPPGHEFRGADRTAGARRHRETRRQPAQGIGARPAEQPRRHAAGGARNRGPVSASEDPNSERAGAEIPDPGR